MNGDTKLEIFNSEKYLFGDGYHRRLQIRTPMPSDSGVYECEAELQNPPDGGSYPKQSARANLTVYGKIISNMQLF